MCQLASNYASKSQRHPNALRIGTFAAAPDPFHPWLRHGNILQPDDRR